jgi:rhodanese-related sulfurtransferase
LSSIEFEKRIRNAGIQLLDVRTSQEYASGHLKDALHADWLKREEFKERVQYLDKSKPVYLYCGSGVRSSDAAKWLRNAGFGQVTELEKGIIAWKKNNLPVEALSEGKQMTMPEYLSLLDTSSVVLMDFGAKWCPPCKKMEPVLEQLQKELSTDFRLINIDAGIHVNIMQELHVQALPTFIIYKKGKETWRKEGLVSLEELKSNIK